MTQAAPSPAPKPLDPALLAFIKALARINARRDYAARHPEPPSKA